MTGDNYIKGVDFSSTPPEQVPQRMEQLIGNLNYRLGVASTDEEILAVVLETHIQFEKIHPFSDGNGRTGRIVMNYSLLAKNLPPLIIRKSEKDEYMQILGDVQMKFFPSDEDVEKFLALAKPIMKDEVKRMNSFSDKASKQSENVVESNTERKTQSKDGQME